MDLLLQIVNIFVFDISIWVCPEVRNGLFVLASEVHLNGCLVAHHVPETLACDRHLRTLGVEAAASSAFPSAAY